jgi:replication-associated recombination protein RarA
MIRGHDQHMGPLRATLPTAALFHGPYSVGKYTAAQELAAHHGITGSDLMQVSSLTAASVGPLVEFSRLSPVGRQRLAIIKLRRASEAQSALLKAVEDAPDSTKFIFLADSIHHVIPPLRSRTHTSYFKSLSDEDVHEILVHECRVDPQLAAKMVPFANGHVRNALESSALSERKRPVLQIIRSFHEKSVALLEKQAQSWTQEDTEMLATWCREALSGRWRVFTQEESEIQGTGLPLRILVALRSNTRPRLLIRSALTPILLGA